MKITVKKVTSNGKVIDGYKVCAKCLRNLPIHKFRKNKHLQNGYTSYCVECKCLSRNFNRLSKKMELIIAYGGKCACCGETQIEFLTVEHLNRDGKLHRKAVSKGKVGGVYKDLKARGYPKDKYTVLCWNCNLAKRYGKPCPHTKEYKQHLKIMENALTTWQKSKKRASTTLDNVCNRYFSLKKKLNEVIKCYTGS